MSYGAETLLDVTTRLLDNPQPWVGGDLEFLLFRQAGVIARRQAVRFLSPKAIRHRLESGRWQLAHRSVYVTHTGAVTAEQRRWIALLSVGRGGLALIAGESALAVLGFQGARGGPIHVLVPAVRRDSDLPPGARVHHTRHLPVNDRHPRGCPPCTMPARSVIDAAQWPPTEEAAVSVIAAAFQQRLVGLVDVEPVLARMTHAHRRPLIMAAIADVAGGAESIHEIDFARLCRRAGLPEPSPQVMRTDRAGRRRYRDVYFDAWRVHVEIDGGQHREVRAWWADMRQHNEIAIAGECLLRFPGWVLRHRPADVVADVRAALHAAGWRPVSGDRGKFRPLPGRGLSTVTPLRGPGWPPRPARRPASPARRRPGRRMPAARRGRGRARTTRRAARPRRASGPRSAGRG